MTLHLMSAVLTGHAQRHHAVLRHRADIARPGLMVAALGVVFGDIGTSPLYALQAVFGIDGGMVRATPEDIYGVISLVFWSVTLVVSAKYVGLVLRADNAGEGGVLALSALVRRSLRPQSALAATVLALGVLGACLFYGDSVITPAISVLSAVDGLRVAVPELAHLVVPAAVLVLVGLFAVQRFGTARIGGLFGPVMLVWFAAIGLAGLGQVIRAPGILRGLSPAYALLFVADRPLVAFVALGAVVLAVTGAEALYADVGQFGRDPIRRAWLWVAFPALTLSYLGQAGLVAQDQAAKANPFFLLLPAWAQLPMVLLATAATVIASQAVISGAFSVSRQAIGLGLLPRLTVRQTSGTETGQVYIPAVDALLFVAVLVVTVSFGSAARLATAYGVAVTCTLVITTALLLTLARLAWRWPVWQVATAAMVVGGLELAFVAANLGKIGHGGWLPLLIAASLAALMVVCRHRRADPADDVAAPSRLTPSVLGESELPVPFDTSAPGSPQLVRPPHHERERDQQGQLGRIRHGGPEDVPQRRQADDGGGEDDLERHAPQQQRVARQSDRP
jgi:KUP system potassium uptake protein